MASRSKQKSAPAFSLKDGIFILYSHKWKIFLLTVLGLSGAGYLYLNEKPVYRSSSELLVRYVVDRSSVDSYEEQGGVGARFSEFILGSEIKILTSIDLAYQVAEELGVDVVLTQIKGDRTVSHAASVIRQGTIVKTKKFSNIMTVSFNHPDREVARRILNVLIERYFERHLEIRRSTGAHDLLVEQVDTAAAQLKATEKNLNEIKVSEGILDLTSSLASLELQRSTIEQSLLNTKAELAEQRVRLVELQKIQKSDLEKQGDRPKAEPSVPSITMATGAVRMEYQDLSNQISSLRSWRSKLLTKYTSTNSTAVSAQRQIDALSKKRKELIEEYPSLITVNTTNPSQRVNLYSGQEEKKHDIDSQQVTVAALLARLKVLAEQKDEVGRQISRISHASGEIDEIERRKKSQTEHLERIQSVLKQSRLDENLDPSKMPNIATIQKPSPAVPVMDAQMQKVILGLAGSGLILGVGIAMLIELLLDRRVKRAGEIEERLQIPLMLSIPDVPRKEQQNLNSIRETESGEKVREHFINPYTCAIRDRLFYHFELENVDHRPKLVAVTSLTEGAGTSVIANGLAAALQGADEARILLIDMTREQSHDFKVIPKNRTENRPVIDLAKTQRVTLSSALMKGARSEQDTLYVSSGTLSGQGTMDRQLAPRKLFEMLPRFRDSEFDYIVFDMPPVSPISPTVAMAGIMDQVVLVLDAQNTDRGALKKNFEELSKGRAKVFSVFNKSRSRLPKWLEG